MSPRHIARIAGAFYVLAVLTAAFAERLARGALLYAVGLAPVACFVIVTLLIYRLVKPVDGRIALFAAIVNLIGLAFEAFEWQPFHVNVALIFHGLYCLALAYLFFRSTFLPKLLAVLMAIGGLAWLTDLSTPLTDHLAPYNLLVGFNGEGLPMLWLLILGVDERRWRALTGAQLGSPG